MREILLIEFSFYFCYYTNSKMRGLTIPITLLELKRDKEINPEPFLKWAGGKGQLLPQYNKFFPQTFNNYLEPFLGGGAVFFHLYSTGKITPDKKVILIDSNEDLINTYKVIQNRVDLLVAHLKSGKYVNEESVYYEIREWTPTNLVERAARTIYLNKTCYNGLYRVNKKGKFNVPFGRYKNPLICDKKNLKTVNRSLKGVKLIIGDFSKCLKYAELGDFIYFDPPYQPISSTSNFTSYTKDSFGLEDQKRLADVFRELDKRKCKVMLSNSDTPFIRKLYKQFRIEVVRAKRYINSNPAGRGEVRELVILNY